MKQIFNRLHLLFTTQYIIITSDNQLLLQEEIMTKEKELIQNQMLSGERALFGKHGLYVKNTIFHDGESPLKECSEKLPQMQRSDAQKRIFPQRRRNSLALFGHTTLQRDRKGRLFCNELRQHGGKRSYALRKLFV